MQTSKPVWTDIYILIIIVMESFFRWLIMTDQHPIMHVLTCSFLGHVPISMKHLCILLV